MKTNLFLSVGLGVAILSGMISCQKDAAYPDVDGGNPELVLTSEHIQTEAGREIAIAGTVADADGISTIHLKCADLNIDKTIDIIEIYEEPLTSYDLNYKFPIKEEETGDNFKILVTITDVGGRKASGEILVTMDGDFEPPFFSIAPSGTLTTLQKAVPAIKINFTAEDKHALDYVTLKIDGVPAYETPVRFEADGAKTMSKTIKVELPAGVAQYDLTLCAVDKWAYETEVKAVISVSELPDFPKIYLADVDDAAKLNSDLFGVPMMVRRTAEYEYTAYYYSKAEGAGIRFIPQKSDFEPICFGIDPENENALTSDPETAKPIVLPGKGYYKIVVNILECTYSVEAYTPDTAVLNVNNPGEDSKKVDHGDGAGEMPFYIVAGGYGWEGANWTMNWNGGARILSVDSENPYLLYTEFDFMQEEVKLVLGSGHWWGWWPNPSWKFESGANDSGENEYNTLNGGNEMTEVKVPGGKGKYRFEFDYHLLRSKLVPVE